MCPNLVPPLVAIKSFEIITKQSQVSDNVNSAVLLWTNRSLETLWLLTVVLVPIVFFRPENFLSEAVIAYLEVPKIALLRTLVGLMVILWLIEWGLSGRFPLASRVKHQSLKIEAQRWYG